MLKKNLSVVPYGKDTPDANLWTSASFNKELDWWNPPKSLDGTLVKCTQSEWLIVWYVNGWLYVSAGNI